MATDGRVRRVSVASTGQVQIRPDKGPSHRAGPGGPCRLTSDPTGRNINTPHDRPARATRGQFGGVVAIDERPVTVHDTASDGWRPGGDL